MSFDTKGRDSVQSHLSKDESVRNTGLETSYKAVEGIIQTQQSEACTKKSQSQAHELDNGYPPPTPFFSSFFFFLVLFSFSQYDGTVFARAP